MKKLIFILSILFTLNVFGYDAKPLDNNILNLVPGGYLPTEIHYGDLNKDGQDDIAILIKGTNKNEVVLDSSGELLDRNRRGIIVALKDGDNYKVVSKNLDCFASEFEDGGVYYYPELWVHVSKGNLYIKYTHGRYGYWGFTYRYDETDFRLIGFDNSENRGPVVLFSSSINFLTGKMLFRENINRDEFDPTKDKEVFKEIWKKITPKKDFSLSKVDDFVDLYTDNLVDIID